jgi:peroxiredoxin
MKLQLASFVAVAALMVSTAFTVEPGQKAPDFTLPDTSGKEHSLSDFKGKTVVLEWTCTTCPFVVDIYERNVSQDIYNKFKDNENFVYLAVDSSHFTNAEDTNKFTKDHSIPFPTLHDPEGTVGKAYKATRTPQVFVIDAEGIVRYNGAIDSNALNREETTDHHTINAIKAVLAGQTVETPTTKAWGCSVKYGKKMKKDKKETSAAGSTKAVMTAYSSDKAAGSDCASKCSMSKKSDAKLTANADKTSGYECSKSKAECSKGAEAKMTANVADASSSCSYSKKSADAKLTANAEKAAGYECSKSKSECSKGAEAKMTANVADASSSCSYSKKTDAKLTANAEKAAGYECSKSKAECSKSADAKLTANAEKAEKAEKSADCEAKCATKKADKVVEAAEKETDEVASADAEETTEVAAAN